MPFSAVGCMTARPQACKKSALTIPKSFGTGPNLTIREKSKIILLLVHCAQMPVILLCLCLLHQTNCRPKIKSDNKITVLLSLPEWNILSYTSPCND